MEEILKPQKNCWGIFDVNKTGLLIDGRHFYRAFYHAALKAKHYILLTGWQFDSEAKLLRGEDLKEEAAKDDVRFLPFLNSLCQKNPNLEIFILAWDYSILFSMKREWFQDWVFKWKADRRIHFRFDNRHAIGASHHQKFVVIDGLLAFVGGMDICSNRWDDRRHLVENPQRRNPNNEPYELYHDIQTYHLGPAAEQLTELFKIRWQHSEGGELKLPSPSKFHEFFFEPSIAIFSKRMAISRTQAKTFSPHWETVQEIRTLYQDAVRSAEKLIYMENQYLSSQSVYQAFIDRMKMPHRSRLQIIIILPQKPHALIEEISLGIAQAKILHNLQETASQCGHSLGIYYTTSLAEDDRKIPVYIHAKLLLIDDRFLTIGSANTTNRSMGLDTELNVSWEANPQDQPSLIRSIRRVRVSLLAEHTRVRCLGELRSLARGQGLVDFLNHLADQSSSHLQHHSLETYFEGNTWLKDLDPEDLAIDPEKPIIEETIFELLSDFETQFFSKGISWLNGWILNREKKPQRKGGSGGNLHIFKRFGYKSWIVLIILLLSIFILFSLLYF